MSDTAKCGICGVCGFTWILRRDGLLPKHDGCGCPAEHARCEGGETEPVTTRVSRPVEHKHGEALDGEDA